MDTNKNKILLEIMRFCKAYNMDSYYELKAYAYDHDKDDGKSCANLSPTQSLGVREPVKV